MIDFFKCEPAGIKSAPLIHELSFEERENRQLCDLAGQTVQTQNPHNLRALIEKLSISGLKLKVKGGREWAGKRGQGATIDRLIIHATVWHAAQPSHPISRCLLSCHGAGQPPGSHLP